MWKSVDSRMIDSAANGIFSWLCPEGTFVVSGQSALCQSGLSGSNREIRAFFAYFGGRRADFLCSPDCVAEGSRIRTLGTGLKPVRADVCVGCAESTNSEFLRRLPAPHSTR